MRRKGLSMRGSVSKATGRTSIDLLHEGIKQSVVHVNVGQQMLVVTEDKMRLGLNELVHAARNRQAWQAPAAMFLTEIAVFTTANFHAAIGVSGDQWQALFRALLVVTFLWLVTAVVRGRPGPSVKSFLDSLKNPQQPLGPHDEALHANSKKVGRVI
jgi:hypothetical protein